GMPPFPGVLMPIGHSTNGKAAESTQRGAILLARHGLAALAYDPIGQGERRQLLDSQGKPALGSSTTEHTMVGIGALLTGQNTAALVAFGLEHADYVPLHAPQPSLVCAATHDFFDIQGSWSTFREAKRIYGLLGHGERVDLFESDSGHGFPRPQREAMLRWM